MSSISANPKSSSDYLRFKGQVEEEIKNLNFPKVAIMRPSFLMGKRKENRIVERVGIPIFNFLSLLLVSIGWSLHRKANTSFKKFVRIFIFYLLGLLILTIRF